MKHLKKYKSFLEDGTAAATATTAGMGAVSNAQPGAIAGTTGTSGSGDVSFYMLDKKGKKIKKGSPSEVSDARYLEPAEGITKVKESKLDDEETNVIRDCLQELYDMGFEINEYNLDSEDEEYDIDDDNYGTFKSQEIRISVYKQVEKIWRGNLNLKYSFDKNEVYKKHISKTINKSDGAPLAQQIFQRTAVARETDRSPNLCKSSKPSRWTENLYAYIMR